MSTTEHKRQRFNQILENLAVALDISEVQHQDAILKYQAVGSWLNDISSPLHTHEPEIFPQGSFRLGTVVRPVSGADEYDIDLVCKLIIGKNYTQKELKQMVGDRLKEHGMYKKMMEEGRRCWTLHYADGTRFHMDILPAIPDPDYKHLIPFIGHHRAGEAILITDKKLLRWQRSNPKGFADWFKSRMQPVFDEERAKIATADQLSVEKVPDYKIKTPLQRSVQVLKRHRDIMFEHDQDNKPISCIISTMAGKHYSGQRDILQALESIVSWMMSDPQLLAGEVKNPVDPSENFADKWREHPERREAFIAWVEKANEVVSKGSTVEETNILVDAMKIAFGSRIVGTAISRIPDHVMNPVSVPVHKSPRVQIEQPSKPWRFVDEK